MIAALLLPILAACNNEADSFYEPPEFIFVPDIIQISDNIPNMSNLMIHEDTIFFSSQILIDEETWTYETKIFSMNIDDPNPSPLPNYIPTESPYPDAMGNVNIMTMNMDNDGNIWIVETGWFYRFDVPEDYDGDEWGRYDFYEDLGSVTNIRQLDKNGTELSAVDIGDLSAGFDWFYISAFNLDDAGNLYIGSNEGIFVLNNSGDVQFRLRTDDWVDTLMRVPDGSVAFFGWAETSMMGMNRVLRKIDLSTRDWGEELELPNNAWNIFPGGGDYFILYENSNNLFGVDIETGESVKILNWMESNVFMQYMENVAILSDGRVIASNQTWNDRTGESNVELMLLTKTPYSELPERTVITLASVWGLWSLQAHIVNFNRTSQTHRIHVIDYSEFNNEEDGWDAGLNKLTAEIISGRVPDLLEVSGLPFNQYVARGLLVDLYPMLDADPSLSRGDLMEAVFRTAEMDGSLYRVFPSFWVSSVIGNPAVVGPNPGWNMSEFLAVLDANPRADIPMGSWLTKENFFRYTIWFNIDEYVNWVTGDVSFDSGGFAQLLEIANRFPAEFNYDDMDMGYYMGDDEMISSGRQIMSEMSFGEFQWLQYYRGMYGGDIVFKGFPTESRNGNSIQLSSSLAITTSCKDKDGAWEFLSSILKYEFQSTNNMRGGFPTNKRVFDELITEAMKEPEYEQWYGNFQLRGYTQAEIDQVMQVIESASSIASYDEALMNIIMEGAQDFFTGRSSAQDAARVVQNRASIYVSEQS